MEASVPLHTLEFKSTRMLNLENLLTRGPKVMTGGRLKEKRKTTMSPGNPVKYSSNLAGSLITLTKGAHP